MATTNRYGIITYHVENNLGDESLITQFVNPVFRLVTTLLFVFSSFMVALCTLLSCSRAAPHFRKCRKWMKKRCRFKCCNKSDPSFGQQYSIRSRTNPSTPGTQYSSARI
eukprot:30291_1